jgi:hypothetical protein
MGVKNQVIAVGNQIVDIRFDSIIIWMDTHGIKGKKREIIFDRTVKLFYEFLEERLDKANGRQKITERDQCLMW